MTRCPSCNSLVVYHAGDKLKIRTRMLALSETGAEVVCRRCGADVPIDLALGEELRKALGELPKRLVLRNSAKSLDGLKSST